MRAISSVTALRMAASFSFVRFGAATSVRTIWTAFPLWRLTVPKTPFAPMSIVRVLLSMKIL